MKKTKYDLGIREDNKGNLHSQISAYVLLIFILAIVVTYYLLG